MVYFPFFLNLKIDNFVFFFLFKLVTEYVDLRCIGSGISLSFCSDLLFWRFLRNLWFDRRWLLVIYNFNFDFNRSTYLVVLIETELNCLLRLDQIRHLKVQCWSFEFINDNFRIPNFKFYSIKITIFIDRHLIIP